MGILATCSRNNESRLSFLIAGMRAFNASRDVPRDVPEFHIFEVDRDGSTHERVEYGYPYVAFSLHPSIFEEEHFENASNHAAMEKLAAVICMGIYKM